MSLKRHAPEKGTFRHRQECRVTPIAPAVGFVRKEFFVRSLVTVQGRYRTRTQRHSVLMMSAFWSFTTGRNQQQVRP